jgi:predicted ATPase with chaperone activity
LSIADLASDDRLRAAHVAEAITWRQLDRNTAAPAASA